MAYLTDSQAVAIVQSGPEDLDTESGSESVCRNRFGCGIGVQSEYTHSCERP